jgi:predicted dehydrogenase
MSKIQLAIIGGGALAEAVYLPLLVNQTDFELKALVEYDPERRRALQQKFTIPGAFATVEELDRNCEAAIVAVPNYLHHSITVACLERKIHTLIEKPMAVSASECEALIHAADENNTRLMVAMVRRYYENVRQIKKLITGRSLGRLKNIRIEEGYVFNWPVTSDSLINKKKSGGGVLIDIGVHVLDTLYYWLGKPASCNYYDDSLKNIEAECRLDLSWSSETTATIVISRLRNLSNAISLTFEGGTVTIDIRSSARVSMRLGDGVETEGQFVAGANEPDKLKAFRMQLNDFAAFIKTGKKPDTSLSDAKSAIELISWCYQNKLPLSSRYQTF